MYNTDMPTRAELPTSAQLLRSTAIAVGVAIVILVTIVLPAEYAIDPTGAGRALRLTEMGEIKSQLAEEAARDRQKNGVAPATSDKRSSLTNTFMSLLISPAAAETAASKVAVVDFSPKTEEKTVTLKPGEGTEVKVGMQKGAKVKFKWSVTGGTVNYDMHGESAEGEKSYEKGRSSPGKDGTLEAAFDGSHGWFWRNRGNAPVSINLQMSGPFNVIAGSPVVNK